MAGFLKGKMDQAAEDSILNKIDTGIKTICTDADLIVEAALEDMVIKKQTFKELEDIVKILTVFLQQIHHHFLLRKLVRVLPVL